MKVSKQNRTYKLIAHSEMIEREPVLLSPATVDPKTGEEVPAKYAPPEFDPPENPESAGTFVYRGLKRREYLKVMRILKDPETGEVNFDLDAGYKIAAMVLSHVLNVFVEDEDGNLEPFKLVHDMDGKVSDDSLDFFIPNDIYALAVDIVQRANIGAKQGEK